MREARTEEQIWKIVNGERNKRKKVSEGIRMKEWDQYFRGLLGGVEWKTVWDKGREEGENEQEELRREEFKKAVSRMKDRKAMGEDGIVNEV